MTNKRPASVWRPYVTYTILAICVGVFLYANIRYGFHSTYNSEVLIRIGAKSAVHIVAANQWWRLITAGFVHIGFEHLLMNCVSIYYLGRNLEKILGHWRFLVVYLVSVIGGNLLSLAFNPNAISAGASTGIFGLFAAYIILMRIYPDSTYLRAMGTQYILLVVLNALSGLISRTTDNLGHFGGLIYGGMITFLVGYNPYYQSSSKKKNQLIASVALVIVTILLVYKSQSLITNIKEMLLW